MSDVAAPSRSGAVPNSPSAPKASPVYPTTPLTSSAKPPTSLSAASIASDASDDSAESPSPDDGVIDMDTFQQILELDEGEDDYEFSSGMVWDYFDQAQNTFAELDTAFEEKDLKELTSLGHFLKGSSAQLGVSRVREVCEKIQSYGDEHKDGKMTAEEALRKIGPLLKEVKIDYEAASGWLRAWYKKRGKIPPQAAAAAATA